MRFHGLTLQDLTNIADSIEFLMNDIGMTIGCKEFDKEDASELEAELVNLTGTLDKIKDEITQRRQA